MKKDLHSLAHSFTAGWIRFWFPWVRLFEQQSAGDDTWQLNTKEQQIKLDCKWCNIGLKADEKVYCIECKSMKEWRKK